VSGSSASVAALRGGSQPQASSFPRASALPTWWVLLALTLLAAALRLSTLGQQSLWYDEAFTPVHVLRGSLGSTLHNVLHSENTPPLWYVLEWAISRVLGTGAVALRLLSALAGIATVPVAWAIGCELEGPSAGPPAAQRVRRVAIATGAFVAANPLFVWYSQEARAYGLFALTASLALLCFLRALREPTTRRLAVFALMASLALLTHYFAVFLLVPMALWLLWGARAQLSRVLCALAVPILVGAALIPLILAQGGHGTQWIGEWALASRLEAIPQYYLTGYTGSALGHGVELLVALAILAGVVHGLWCTLTPSEERGASIVLSVAASGVLLPIVLALAGADYLAPRNLVAAMVPLSALLAIAIVARRTGWVGMALAGLVALLFLALAIDVDLSPRLQRGDWAGVAKLLRASPRARAIVTVELGAAPLEYYLPPLANLARGSSVRVSEVDETGYSPLRKSAERPPAPGFHLVESRDIHGLVVYRFTSSVPVTISERVLREHVITLAHPEVLVPMSPGKTT
jgi:mannosyltransferase